MIDSAKCTVLAEKILSGFRSSGKKHLLLAGYRNCGKSSLLKAMFGSNLPGTTTRVVKDVAVFLTENTTGREIRIGLYDILHPGVGNKMQPAFYGFAALAIPALQRCMTCDSPWITLDEIGYLEMANAEYCYCLNKLMDTKQVAAVIRKADLDCFLSTIVRDDMYLVDLDNLEIN